MRKPITIIILSSLALVLVIVAIWNLFLGYANKAHLETYASQALSKEVHINGPLSINLLGGLHFVVGDVHISEEESDLITAHRIDIGLALLPLIVGEVRIKSLELEQPIISIVRKNNPDLIADNSQSIEQTFGALNIATVTFVDATLDYEDPTVSLNAQECDLQMQHFQLGKESELLLQSLSFTAELFCAKFQQNNYTGSNLAITAVATNGSISLAPVTMQFLGGHGNGNILADFSGNTAQYRINYALPQLRLDSLLNTLPPAFGATGALDLTLNLALTGDEPATLTQTANGTIFLHGKDLTISGIDLDEKFAQFESSQNFSLIDAGAFFFAGPLGLLATKGYDFTSLLQKNGGNSEIPSLISDWEIVDGVANAADVAMATRHNRIALQGQLDLVNEQFVDVNMALIDDDGCSLVQQKIGGSFAQPEADQPQLLATVAGPVLKILQQGVALLTDDHCEVFYRGTVQAP